MNKELAARDIIIATLPHVAFDGWTMRALMRGAIEAGYKKTDVIRVFPRGASEAVEKFFALGDQAMSEALAAYSLDTMKIRARITLAVKLSIEQHEPHKEALRRALALQAMPWNLPHGLRALYHTVDIIWHAIGDTSTDFNFYTKRATLAAVYSATILFWLNDQSAGHQHTWDYLDRRIENVMQFERLKQKIRHSIP